MQDDYLILLPVSKNSYESKFLKFIAAVLVLFLLNPFPNITYYMKYYRKVNM